MGFIVQSKGFLTTIQDLGRVGFAQFGVPVSGAMDSYSLRIANILLGNEENEAALEMLLVGSELLFTEANIIAIAGADLSPCINHLPIPLCTAIPIHAGDTLSFQGARLGSYCYVAFCGGLDIPLVMGSRSTYLKADLGGFRGRKLQPQDAIAFRTPRTSLPNMALRHTPSRLESKEKDCVLRVIIGPQEQHFTKVGMDTFLGSPFVVTNECDRMGCRLEGRAIEHHKDGNIISDGISLGAVQVPSHGMPIIMLADRQTVGGYTKIASVISVDIPKFVHCVAGDKVQFEAITVEQAHEIYFEQEQAIAHFKASLTKNMYHVWVNGEPYSISIEEYE